MSSPTPDSASRASSFRRSFAATAREQAAWITGAMSSAATKTVRRIPSSRMSVLSSYKARSTSAIPPPVIRASNVRYTDDGSVLCTATSDPAASTGSPASAPGASRCRSPSRARRSAHSDSPH